MRRADATRRACGALCAAFALTVGLGAGPAFAAVEAVTTGGGAQVIDTPKKADAGRAERLLEQVSEASRKLNYAGEFVYTHGSALDVMRIYHRADEAGGAERLLSLSGPAREVVRDGTRVTCTFADEREVLVERFQPGDLLNLPLSEPTGKLSRHYAIGLAGRDRVAERPAHVLTIEPRANDRYSHRLWIDEATHLLLGSAVVGEGGQVLERVMFTRIQIGKPIAEKALKPSFAGEGYTWFTNHERPTEGAHSPPRTFDVAWLPSGFSLRNRHLQELATSRSPVQHVAYSDGLAMISVFVEELEGKEPPQQGYSTLGAVNAFSRASGQHLVTVVGEIPQGVARRVAASVSIRKP